MNSTIIGIFFRGLIAFVHDRPDTDLMTAYLVDDHHHLPIVAFEMKSENSTCPQNRIGNTYCIQDTQIIDWCFCYIGDPVEIFFQPKPQKGAASLGSRPRREIPGNISEAGDFEWLIRMSNVNKDAAKAKSDDSLEKGTVIARMSFGWESANSCHLDQQEQPNGRFKIHPFKFVSDFTQPSGTFVHEQALSEYAKFNIKFPLTPHVKLIIKKHGGAESIDIQLDCPEGQCPDLLIANEPLPRYDEREELQAFGIHFAEYYRLSEKATDEKKIPIRLNRDTFNVPDMPQRELVDCVDVGNGQLYTCECDPLRNRAALIINNPRTFSPLDIVEAEKHSLAEANRFLRFLNELFKKRAVDTRIICPMAMLEP